MTNFLLSTAFFLGGLVIIYWLHNQYHLDIVVELTSPLPNPPLISVCIPARNEERNIRACVEAILNQDYPNFEVIVLDDRSTDSTSEILLALESDSLLSGLREQAPYSKLSTGQTFHQAGLVNPMPCIRLQHLPAANGFAS